MRETRGERAAIVRLDRRRLPGVLTLEIAQGIP